MKRRLFRFEGRRRTGRSGVARERAQLHANASADAELERGADQFLGEGFLPEEMKSCREESRSRRFRLRRPVAGLLIVAGLAGAVAGALAAIGLDELREETSTVMRSDAPGASTAVEIAKRSAVSLEVSGGTYEGSVRFSLVHRGSGTVLSSDGLIGTNAHLLQGAEKIVVTLPGGEQLLAQLLGIDPLEDLALLRVERTGLTPLARGESRSLHPGDTVFAVGNALALPGGPTITRGIVSALEREVDAGAARRLDHLIQTDAAINDGNSGGPLVDESGRLVGINCGRSAVAENIGFAIAIDHALPILERLANRSFGP